MATTGVRQTARAVESNAARFQQAPRNMANNMSRQRPNFGNQQSNYHQPGGFVGALSDFGRKILHAKVTPGQADNHWPLLELIATAPEPITKVSNATANDLFLKTEDVTASEKNVENTEASSAEVSASNTTEEASAEASNVESNEASNVESSKPEENFEKQAGQKHVDVIRMAGERLSALDAITALRRIGETMPSLDTDSKRKWVVSVYEHEGFQLVKNALKHHLPNLGPSQTSFAFNRWKGKVQKPK